MCVTAQIRYDLSCRDTFLHSSLDMFPIEFADNEIRVSDPDVYK